MKPKHPLLLVSTALLTVAATVFFGTRMPPEQDADPEPEQPPAAPELVTPTPEPPSAAVPQVPLCELDRFSIALGARSFSLEFTKAGYVSLSPNPFVTVYHGTDNPDQLCFTPGGTDDCYTPETADIEYTKMTRQGIGAAKAYRVFREDCDEAAFETALQKLTPSNDTIKFLRPRRPD